MAKKIDTLTGTGQPSERIKAIAEQRATQAAQPAQPETTPETTPDTLTGTGIPSERVQAIATQRAAPTQPQHQPQPQPTQPIAQPIAQPQAEVPKTIVQSGMQVPNWNYGTSDAPVYASQSPQIQAQQPSAQPTQPLTTEIGREQALGQLAAQPTDSTKVAQLKSVRQNLKDDSGQQLWSNLSTISESNPNLLTDRRAYDQAFGYSGKDSGEKAMVDSFWRARNKLDSNSIYQALETGAQVPREATKTSQFEDAINRKAEVNKYENLNAYQLSKEINSSLIPGTQAYNDLMAKNPKLVEDANKLSRVNMGVTARKDTKTDYMQMISDYFTKSQVMQEPVTVEKIMNSDPNIASKSSEVQGIDSQITEAKDRLKNIKAEVTERYKGTGATKATIQAKALAESQDIIDEITMLEANRSSASAALSTLIQNAKDNYTYAKESRQEAIQSQQQQLQNLMAFAKMGMEQDNLDYQRAWDQYRYDTDYLRQEAMKDSDFARELAQMEQQFGYNMELAKMGYGQQERMAGINAQNDLAQLYAQQGFQASRDQIDQQANMVKSLVSAGYPYQDAIGQVSGGMPGVSGGTGGVATSSITREDAIQKYGSTPAVRNFNPGNIMDTGFGGQKVEGERFTRFASPQEGFNALVSKIQNIQAGNSKVYSPNMTLLQYISKYAPSSDNNNPQAYASGIAKNLGISVSTQIKDIDPNALALEHARHEDGNMFRMLNDLGINSKQTMQPVQTATTVATTPTSEQKSNLLAYISTLTPSEQAKQLKSNGLTSIDMANYKEGNLPATTSQYRIAQTIVNDANALLSHPGFGNAVGATYVPGFIPGTDRKGFEAAAKSFVDTLVLPNLDNLKGAMSDKDLEFIRNTAGGLSLDVSEEQYKSTLNKIIKKYSDVLSRGSNENNLGVQNFNADSVADSLISSWK